MAYTETQLALLKVDLGRMGFDVNQTVYLGNLLDAAIARIEKTGVRLSADSADHDQLVVMYAAWLYRKRVNGDAMPRMLRTAINDELCHQKTGAGA